MLLRSINSVQVLCEQACPTVAMLRPRSGQAQWVLGQRYEMTPWVPAREYDDAYGNLCQRFVIPAGEMRLTVTTEVEVADAIAVAPDAVPTPIDELPDEVLVYLLPSRYCPSDTMEERARTLVQGSAPGYAQAARICAWIHEHLSYRYGVSDACTDALATLGHGAGVCRDFAHVGVSLCRALQFPARFVAGYLHRLDPMDMHAWYEVFVGGRWYTFDPTQDRPRGGRIVVAYGRDAADVAFLSNFGPMEVREMRVAVQQAPWAL
jgi:transglutaminase-like putative cysteine protease